MEVYKFIKLDNGDILLEKVVLDNTNYTIIKFKCKSILENIYINNKNKILSSSLENDEIIKLKYKSISENIYKNNKNFKTKYKNNKKIRRRILLFGRFRNKYSRR